MISAENVRDWTSPGEAILLDGGLATELERRGLDVDDPLWSSTSRYTPRKGRSDSRSWARLVAAAGAASSAELEIRATAMDR